MWGFLTALIPLAISLFKDGKGNLIIMLSVISISAMAGWQGKKYVDLKHDVGIEAVAKNKAQIVALKENQQQIVATLQVMKNTLSNVDRTMNDIKGSVRAVDRTNRETQKTVVEIYKDVYQIKLKQSKSGS